MNVEVDADEVAAGHADCLPQGSPASLSASNSFCSSASVDPFHAWPQWRGFSANFQALPTSIPTPLASPSQRKRRKRGRPSVPVPGGQQGRDESELSGTAGGHASCSALPKQINISTAVLFASLMCISVCVLELFSFWPIYTIGFHDVTVAVDAAQKQAVLSMAASTTSSLHRLPTIMKLILANYMIGNGDPAPRFPASLSRILFSLSNIMLHQHYEGYLGSLGLAFQSPLEEWLVFCTSRSNFSRLLGAIVAHPNETIATYPMNPETHSIQQPPQPEYIIPITLQNFFRNASLPMQAVVWPWVKEHEKKVRQLSKVTADDASALAVSIPHEQWSPFHFSTLLSDYFVVVPFQVGPDDGIVRVGYISAWMHTGYVEKMIQEFFKNATRAGGCYMVVDPKRQVVTVNSWSNTSSIPKYSDAGFTPQSVADVPHPLMRSAIYHLQQKRGVDAAFSGNESLVFYHKGKEAQVQTVALTASFGLNVVLVSVILKEDFYGAIFQSIRYLCIVMTAALVFTTAVSYRLAVYMSRSLQKLTQGLRSSKRLQFPTLPMPEAWTHSYVTELVAVEAAYAHVQQQLMALKTVIPAPLLVASDDLTSEATATNSETVPGSGEEMRLRAAIPDGDEAEDLEAKGSGSGDGSASGVATDGGGVIVSDKSDRTRREKARELAQVSKRWQQSMHLNTKVFNEKVNVFQRRYCTVAWVCPYYTRDVNGFDMHDYFDFIYAAALEFKGCIQYLRPDNAVVSFNTHTSLPLHARHACNFAKAVWDHLSEKDRKHMTVLVDTANFLVGTCGSQNGLKSLVVFDVVPLMQLSAVLRMHGCEGISITHTTAKHLESYESLPIEVVMVRHVELPYIIYELRDTAKQSISSMQRTADLFRAGFQHMRHGNYARALKAYRAVGPGDPTARRFVEFCSEKVENRNTEPYFFSFHEPPFSLLSTFLHNRNCSFFAQHVNTLMMKMQHDGLLPCGPVKVEIPSSPIGHRSAQSPRGCEAERADGYGDGSGIHTASSGFPLSAPSMQAGGDISVSKGESDRDGESSGLIEWMEVQSTSSEAVMDFDDPQVDRNPTEELPMMLVDITGRRWNRACKSESNGGFSVVYLAMSEDGLQVAIKFIQKKNRNIPEERLHLEVNVMSKLKHLNIVRYISTCWTDTHIGIIMEYAPGGSLRDIIYSFRALHESNVRHYMVEVLHGLSYLHGDGIAHGDVKPHNILLGMDGVCKLSDFGSTVSEATDLSRSNGMLVFRGTALYTSPEVAAGQSPTAASDIYSLGITFLEMLLGQLPWQWADPAMELTCGRCLQLREVAFVQGVGLGKIVPVVPRHLSMAAQEFASACCNPQPAERPTAQELLSFVFVL